MPVPTDDGRGNLVADGVSENRWVANNGANFVDESVLDRGHPPLVIEERDVLFPRQADHDVKPMSVGKIEEPAGRDGVNPQRVKLRGAHGGKVALDYPCVGKIKAVSVGLERAVGHTPQQKLFTANGQELARNLRPLMTCGARRRGQATKAEILRRVFGQLCGNSWIGRTHGASDEAMA